MSDTTLDKWGRFKSPADVRLLPTGWIDVVFPEGTRIRVRSLPIGQHLDLFLRPYAPLTGQCGRLVSDPRTRLLYGPWCRNPQGPTGPCGWHRIQDLERRVAKLERQVRKARP